MCDFISRNLSKFNGIFLGKLWSPPFRTTWFSGPLFAEVLICLWFISIHIYVLSEKYDSKIHLFLKTVICGTCTSMIINTTNINIVIKWKKWLHNKTVILLRYNFYLYRRPPSVNMANRPGSNQRSLYYTHTYCVNILL